MPEAEPKIRGLRKEDPKQTDVKSSKGPSMGKGVRAPEVLVFHKAINSWLCVICPFSKKRIKRCPKHELPWQEEFHLTVQPW